MDLNTADTGVSAPATEVVVDTAPVAAESAANAAVTTEAKPSIDDTLRAAWDKANPPRVNGRFAPRAGATT